MTPEEQSYAQWNAIVALLKGQIGTGKLPTVVDVRPSVHLWTEQVPAIGVQLVKTSETPEYTHKHKLSATFNILVATKSVEQDIGTTSMGPQIIPPNLDDAFSKLHPIIADGNGNGIANILRSPANYLLGGSVGVVRSAIHGTEYNWQIGPGADGSGEVFAYAMMTYVVESYVAVALS